MIGSSDKQTRLNVLLVEDEPLIRRVLARLLKAHNVTLADNNASALDFVLQGSELDLVICDVITPLMTGIEFCKRAREARPELSDKFLFVTALGPGDQGFDETLELGLVLRKPFGQLELTAAIERITSVNIATRRLAALR